MQCTTHIALSSASASVTVILPLPLKPFSFPKTSPSVSRLLFIIVLIRSCILNITKDYYITGDAGVDRCWHRLKLSGASGHTTTMNAGFVVMTMIMMMIRMNVMIVVMVAPAGFPFWVPKREPKVKPKKGTFRILEGNKKWNTKGNPKEGAQTRNPPKKNQAVTTCGSLAARLQGNGESMRKWRGRGGNGDGESFPPSPFPLFLSISSHFPSFRLIIQHFSQVSQKS